MTIAERIRLYRQQLKMSQTELSEKSGVNIKSLSRYELGNSIPAADILKAIADALGVTADALLTDDQLVVKDRVLFQKFEEIQNMEEGEEKKLIIRFLDLAIRDAKARQAYAS